MYITCQASTADLKLTDNLMVSLDTRTVYGQHCRLHPSCSRTSGTDKYKTKTVKARCCGQITPQTTNALRTGSYRLQQLKVTPVQRSLPSMTLGTVLLAWYRNAASLKASPSGNPNKTVSLFKWNDEKPRTLRQYENQRQHFCCYGRAHKSLHISFQQKKKQLLRPSYCTVLTCTGQYSSTQTERPTKCKSRISLRKFQFKLLYINASKIPFRTVHTKYWKAFHS
jgi:hypothetical protein